MQMTKFLKRVLILDAASCLALGAMLIAGGGALAELLGLAHGLTRGAGLLLLPIALFILWLGTRQATHPALVWAVILGNVGWTAESLVTTFSTPGISGLGSLFVAGQAAAVLGLAGLEFIGLQSSRTDGKKEAGSSPSWG